MTVILVAEDDPRIAAFVRKGLSRAGHSARFTTDGWTAYRLLRQGGVDLVLLDAGLPRVDGFEVVRRLRAAGSDVPVVMMLDRDALWDSMARLKGSADDYVVKPFCFERLLAKIEQLLIPHPTDDDALPRRFASGPAPSFSKFSGARGPQPADNAPVAARGRERAAAREAARCRHCGGDQRGNPQQWTVSN